MEPEIAAFERMAAWHWQGTEQEPLGDWLLRAAGGFTKRANSVLPAGDPGVPAGAAVAAVEAWYARRGLEPAVVIATRSPAGPDALDHLLAGRGWTTRGFPPVLVMTARCETVVSHRRTSGGTGTGRGRGGGTGTAPGPGGRTGTGPGRDAGVRLRPEPDEEWLAAWSLARGPLPPPARRVLLSAPAQVFASVRRDGRTVATGRLSLAGGWAGLTAVAVDPAWRRAGLGLAVTVELAACALARGIGRMFLQVEDDNLPARRLYAGCGFTTRHHYHYRFPPPPG